MSGAPPEPRATRDISDALLTLLAFGAGAVDAISYLGLGRVFTANMTGNLVLLGLSASRSEGAATLRAAVSLMTFVAGVFAATRIAGRAPKAPSWTSRVTVALALEVACQATLLASWAATSGRPGATLEGFLVGLSALAMGLQSGAVRALGIDGVSTTYITGTLTGLIGGLATSSGSRRDWARRARVVGALLVGAVCSGLLVVHARSEAPALPLVVTLLVVAVAYRFYRLERDAPGHSHEGDRPRRCTR